MKFIQSSNIYSKRIAGAVVLLEKNKRFVRELNSTAGYIWGMLRTTQSPEDIIERICKEFDVDKDQVNRDVKEFLSEYRKAGLIRSLPE